MMEDPSEQPSAPSASQVKDGNIHNSDTTVEDTTVEDTTMKDTTVEDTTVEDTTVEDTTVEDTTVEDTTMEDITVEIPFDIFCCTSTEFATPHEKGQESDRFQLLETLLDGLKSYKDPIAKIKDQQPMNALFARHGTLFKLEEISSALAPTRFFYYRRQEDRTRHYDELIHNLVFIGSIYKETDVMVKIGCNEKGHENNLYLCRLMKRKDPVVPEEPAAKANRERKEWLAAKKRAKQERVEQMVKTNDPKSWWYKKDKFKKTHKCSADVIAGRRILKKMSRIFEDELWYGTWT